MRDGLTDWEELNHDNLATSAQPHPELARDLDVDGLVDGAATVTVNLIPPL
jgi:hypothetical protein